MLCFIGCKEYNGKVYLYTDSHEIWCAAVGDESGYPGICCAELADIPVSVLEDYCYAVKREERKLEAAGLAAVAVPCQ